MNEYRVTGPRPYRGYKPGEVLIADPADGSVIRALEIGSLQLVAKASSRLKIKPPTPPEADEPAVPAAAVGDDSTDDGGS